MLIASSTMSWKLRSSSLGDGIMSWDSWPRRRARSRARGFFVFGLEQVERVDEVLLLGLACDLVADADVEPARLVLVGERVALDRRDPLLVLVERLFAVVLGASGGLVVVGREHEVVDPAAEVGPVDPLPRRGAED